MSHCQAVTSDYDSRQAPVVTAVTSETPVWRHRWRCGLYTNTASSTVCRQTANNEQLLLWRYRYTFTDM